MAAVDNEEGPVKDPKYPLEVLYCAECGLPPELCEYLPPVEFDKCKPWLAKNVPDMYPDIQLDSAETGLEDKLKDAEITEGAPKKVTFKESKKKKKGAVEPEVVIQRSNRKGRKQVTVVFGLDLFGIKIPDVAKVCKKKFSCGASAVKAPDQRDTLEVQGDRVQPLATFLRDEHKIPESRIFYVDDAKVKHSAFDVLADAATE